LHAHRKRHPCSERAARRVGPVLRGDPGSAWRQTGGQAGMIADYLNQLRGALRDDPAFSAQILQEVRDHLEEALAAEDLDDRCAAERRVVERFGDPRELAAQFAPLSLARRTRHAGIAILVATVVILIMMKARVLWYGFAEWKLAGPAQTLASRIV